MGYRGEIMAKFKFMNYDLAHRSDLIYEIGERIVQLIIIPYPKIELVESDTLSDSERGTNGYGSTNK